MSSQERSPTSGGTIRVHRVRTVWPVVFTVWIDNVQMGMLHRGVVAEVQVPSGSHNLQLRWKPFWSFLGARDSDTVRFLVEPGKVIHFDSKHVFDFKVGVDSISLRRHDGPPATVPSASGAADARILRMTETTNLTRRRVGHILGRNWWQGLAALISLAALVVAVVQLTMVTPSTPAPTPTHGLITNSDGLSYLWVFAAPTPESSHAGYVFNNTQVDVICAIQGKNGRGENGLWYKLHYAGKDAYINSRFVNTGTKRLAAC